MGLQAMEMVKVINLEQSIRWHLQYNLSPPVPNKIIWMVPAYVIVEVYHLEPWLNELDMG